MSDGQSASPPPQNAPLMHASEESADSAMGAEVEQADPKPLMATGPAHTMAPPASHQNLAQQMHVFFTRTEIQQSR